jgi:hypothetical protein
MSCLGRRSYDRVYSDGAERYEPREPIEGLTKASHFIVWVREDSIHLYYVYTLR